MITSLSIDEAAAALGVSRPTIRRRLRNGQLVGSRVRTPQGFRWEVRVDVAGDSPDDSAAGSQAPPRAVSNGTPDEGARLRDEHIADLRRRVEDQAREIAELHRLLAQAQQHGHLLTDSAPGESPTPRPPETRDAPQTRWPEGRRWWQRLLWS